MAEQPLLIVKTGTAPESIIQEHGNFELWIRRGLAMAGSSIVVADVARGEPLPASDLVAGVVITGSPAMVSDPPPWVAPTAGWLVEAVAAHVPTLGICFGHQLLALALGGAAGPNPRGREIGTVSLRLTPEANGDRLLAGLGPEVAAQATHLETVLALPPGAVLLATSALDLHHAFRVGDHVWGVQFHPEFSAAVTRAYIRERRDQINHEGLDADGLAEAVSDTPAGTEILRRFAKLCTDHR